MDSNLSQEFKRVRKAREGLERDRIVQAYLALVSMERILGQEIFNTKTILERANHPSVKQVLPVESQILEPAIGMEKHCCRCKCLLIDMHGKVQNPYRRAARGIMCVEHPWRKKDARRN